MNRRSTGDGTVYKRADGRYEAAAYLTTTEGRRKRVRAYADTRRGAEQQLRQLVSREESGLRIPDVRWRLDDYLDQWLQTTAQVRCRPKTIELYSRVVEHYLKPRLGKVRLDSLGTRAVQSAFDQAAADGVSVRMVNEMRKVLGAALTQAQREELILRNPARLARVTPYRAPEVVPWTASQIGEFLAAAEADHLYPAFILLILYGLRRGEVVGLQWQDIDYDRRVIRIRHQLQSLGGNLELAPVKTRAGERDLPLLPLAERLLSPLRKSTNASGLVILTAAGRPVAPHSLGDAFQRIRRRTALPPNRLHDLRHATATMLKSLGVPVRDAQAILGHASPITTQTIYQHTADAEQRTALEGVERLVEQLTATRSRQRSRQEEIRQMTIGDLQRSRGGPGGARTLDTLLKSLPIHREDVALTEALELVHVSAIGTLLGCAAVNAAVKASGQRPKSQRKDAQFWAALTRVPNGPQP